MSDAAFDVVVIGGGIAGASVAAELSATHRVVVLERESQPGYHSTGRSAALFSEIYGNPVIRALTRASRRFLTEPPSGFAEAPLVRPRGALYIARADQCRKLEAFAALPDVAPAVRHLSTQEARRLCPILRPDHAVQAVLEPDAWDIDVHALHQGCLRRLARQGGRLATDAEVAGLARDADGWRVDSTAGVFRAPIVVDAAGAWAEAVAALAGVAPIGLVPCRRTALLVPPPSLVAIEAWPMVIDADETFYFKPDAGLLLLSPADATPTAPSDVQPDELDIAVAIDRVERATTLEVRTVRRKWAGLRSFVADRGPVIGFDAGAPGFFWLAGQGGYGIQTAPAAGRLAAALVRGEAVPADLAALGITADAVGPARCRPAAG